MQADPAPGETLCMGAGTGSSVPAPSTEMHFCFVGLAITSFEIQRHPTIKGVMVLYTGITWENGVPNKMTKKKHGCLSLCYSQLALLEAGARTPNFAC